MALYLVTGGAGFIGSHLVDELVGRREQVRVLDNFSTGKRENLEQLVGDIELVEGDIRSYHIVREVVKDVDYVLHHAALPSVPRSVNDPITTNEVNVGGTLNILDAAKDAGVERVIYASSSSVYGANTELPKREDMVPQPISPYAVAKLTGEKYCHVFSRTYGLETVSLRYFNVFGPRQDPKSEYSAVIPRFISSMIDGHELTIHGDGTQSRDFTHVDNIVSANLLAVHAGTGARGEVYNLACGQSTSLNEMVELIAGLIGVSAKVKYGRPRPGDVPHSLASIEKAKTEMRYVPLVSAREGLEKIVGSYG